ncbi:MAG: amino acid ABC transporter permease [Limnochordia bacterium]|jgi:glutamine transport system permease protein|nr:amino acid ABC transporter permease [Bacillota bacterium]HOB09324.1 amino acid ABC transporter permease [Limnochordia bacterium]NLH30599.1 amino acid ABC transporter permease [Bacillota bacterium]HPT93402.1 amino acid ABC transporter permease [Limnochordia bacterium]HPZ30138.1 amino acid ABC transporter permease [Limnochordia bacterium]
MDFQWNLVWDSVPTLLDGAILTLKLTTIAVSIGVVLGTVFGIMRLSRTPLRYLAVGYIDFIRGTPLLVQIFIIYYGMPPFIGTAIPPYIAALIALSINSGAYVAEIVRAGIQSIEKGQTEAALSLGLSSSATMIHIILPQAFKRIIPPLGNEFIALLKDSSLVSAIALEELVRKAQIVAGRTFRPFEVWFVVAIMYLIMTVAVSRIVSILERRLRVGE